MPIIFFNIGWMEEYKGQTENDIISGGHEYIRQHGTGHEQYNFLAHRSIVYGYAPIKWYGKTEAFQQISIENLGAEKNDDSINDVTVVFIAKSPFNKKTYVVGWYKNATVYRYPHELDIKNRILNKNNFFYVCKTKEEDAYCIPVSQRIFVIPTAQSDKKGGYGQSTIWYATSRKDIQDEVLLYINNGKISYQATTRQIRVPVDQETKKTIEINAVNATIKFYKNLGFQVQDVSLDNCGWDLTVYNKFEEFYVEVKGTASNTTNFQLTPNEYANLKKHHQKYKISTATNCLSKLKLDIFSVWYDKKKGTYLGRNDKGFNLLISEKIETYAVCGVASNIHK